MVKPKRPQRRGCLVWLGRSLLLTLVLGFVLLNGVAARYAWVMTNFDPQGLSFNEQLSGSMVDRSLRLLSGITLPRPENRASPEHHNLAFETLQIDLGNAEYLEAWHVTHPNPRGMVVMFAGYGGAKEGLLGPSAHFHRFGYSSLLVDMRGAGGSSGNVTTLGMREALDVAAAFEYAQARWPGYPMLGYGMSMGSVALMRAVAVEEVRPSALILEGPFDRLLTTTRHRFASQGLPTTPFAELLLFWGGVQLGWNPFEHNPIEYAPSIDVPTLIFQGEHDPWITNAEALAVHEAFPGTSELVFVPDAGHSMPFLYVRDELWLTQVREFLDQRSGT